MLASTKQVLLFKKWFSKLFLTIGIRASYSQNYDIHLYYFLGIQYQIPSSKNLTFSMGV